MKIDLSKIPLAPAENDAMPGAQPSLETLQLLARRRSTKAVELVEPGPNLAEIETLLRLAARAPDHGKLGPWRFIVMEGEGRARFAEAVAEAVDDPNQKQSARMLFTRAPVCIAVVSNVQPHPKIPEWEQLLSSAAVCYGLLIAAHAMNYAGCWLTEWPAFDANARAGMGLAEHERIAGFLYLGTAKGEPPERVRADWASRTTWA